ncbi:MAG: DUF1320 family protein [Cytophagales bacterium]|nr:DUF1320 family protein [Cytophagales bacterium]
MTQDRYLHKEELKTVAPLNLVDALSETEDSLVDALIAENIDLMKSYLQGRYDVEELFSKTGDSRDRILLKYLKDMVIHDLHMRYVRAKPQEALRQRYEDALSWLHNISRGYIQPLVSDSSSKEHSPRLGSHSRYSTRF